VLSCQNGLWELQASKYWRDPVERLADLPACNADRVGSTHVVMTGASGSPGENDPKTFSCIRNHLTGVFVWEPLFVANNGSLDTPGRLLADTYYIGRIEVEQTACSVEGLVARDATGNLLSCTGGSWGPVARSPRTYRYVFTEDEIWTVPNGVKSAFVTMAGGGSSGTSYGVIHPLRTGNTGGYVFSQPINFVDGEKIRITVGKGGKEVMYTPSSTLETVSGQKYPVMIAPNDPHKGIGGYPGTSTKLESIDRGVLLLECAGGSGPYLSGYNNYDGYGPSHTISGTTPLYSSTNGVYHVASFNTSFTVAEGPYASVSGPGRCGPVAGADTNYGIGNPGQTLYYVGSGEYFGGTTPFGYGSGATVQRQGCYITKTSYGTCTGSRAGRDGIVFIDVTY
jgi:hypothetical protein